MNAKNLFGYSLTVFGIITAVFVSALAVFNGNDLLNMVVLGASPEILYKLAALFASVYCISFLLLGAGTHFIAGSSKKKNVKKLSSSLFLVSFIFFIIFIAAFVLKARHKTAVNENYADRQHLSDNRTRFHSGAELLSDSVENDETASGDNGFNAGEILQTENE